jgi:hypothetical protein
MPPKEGLAFAELIESDFNVYSWPVPTKGLRLTEAYPHLVALLGTCLVYTEGKALQIVPLTGDAGSRFGLPGQALLRPVVRDDEVFGRYEGGLYVFHEGDRELTLVRFQDTPLERLTLEDHVEKSGDLVVACVGGDTVACDLSGRLRWRVPLDGRVVTGPGGEICVFGTTVCRLAAEDGRVIWRRYRAPGRFYWGARATFDGRLVAFGKTELSVYDLETGRLLLDLRQHRDLVRTAYNIFISLLRMTSTDNTLVVGFEDRVIGIDATPASEVPTGSRATDPANALSQLELLSKLPTQRLRRAQRLAGIGRNIADTPGAASEILPLVRELIWKEDGSPDETVVSAFHWLDDDVEAETVPAVIPEKAVLAKQLARAVGPDGSLHLVVGLPVLREAVIHIAYDDILVAVTIDISHGDPGAILFVARLHAVPIRGSVKLHVEQQESPQRIPLARRE